MTEVKPNQLWKSNDDRNPRTVRVFTVDSRWAEVRNTETNRLSRIELYTLTRTGRSGWTYVGEADTPLPTGPTVEPGQEYIDRYEERHRRTRTLRVMSVEQDGKATCESWYDEPGSLSKTTRLKLETLLGPGYRLVSDSPRRRALRELFETELRAGPDADEAS